MKIKLPLTRLSVFAVIVAGLMGTIGVTPGSASGGTSPWTSVGSTGIVDETDAGHAALGTCAPPWTIPIGYLGPCVQVVGGPLPYTITMRYQLEDTGIFPGPANLTARFRDNGSQAQVYLYLRKVDLGTGAMSTVLTLDSNAFAPSTSLQTENANACESGQGFDFTHYSYFIEARLTKSSSAGAPALEFVEAQGIVC